MTRIETTVLALVAGLMLVAGKLHAQTAAPADEAANETYRVTLRIQGVDADRGGVLRCALFADADGFPKNDGRALARTRGRGDGATRTCTFTVPGPGVYAASIGHDENGNGHVDSNIFGAPTEGWGTTRNVTHALRAPSFDESAFRVASPRTTQVVRMHY